uniref:Vascular endothelial growth factor Bb n=1 Tax=Sinocyclocheilus anshuiensis TaxID=1608454 RepID=A0A671Q3B2_9TELE
MRVFLCVLCLVLSGNIYVSSLCKPRETLVEVEHEFPEAMLGRVLPSCVPLPRCGGCCSDEATLCVSVGTRTTVMQVSQCNGFRQFIITCVLPFVEHSQCQCRGGVVRNESLYLSAHMLPSLHFTN